MSNCTKPVAALLLTLSVAVIGVGRADAATKRKPVKKVKVTTTKPAPKKATTTTAGTPPTTAAPTTAVPTTVAPITPATATPTTAAGSGVATTTVPAPVPAPGGIAIKDFSFGTAPINIKLGEAITITNLDGAQHTVTADDGSFGSDIIAGGKTALLTVAKAGSYAFHCNIHPTMKGTLVVA